MNQLELNFGTSVMTNSAVRVFRVVPQNEIAGNSEIEGLSDAAKESLETFLSWFAKD